MTATEANSSRDDEFHFPTNPSDDWEMNVFLNELADDMTADDLKKIKHLLTGLNGTGKAVLEEIKDPLDLFQHLRQRKILTRDNIVYLQAMLWHTRRKDMHTKFVKFAKRRGNIIHFYAPSNMPENGYEFVKFHIAGREKMNRNKLEELRTHVSQALCVPLEYIIASGIEATNSILVTFMVPEGYGHVLYDLSNKDKEYLGSRGIDAIWYNGKLISCIDVEITEDDESIKKEEELKILMDQKSKLDHEVESLQVHNVRLQQNLRLCQKEMKRIDDAANNKVAIITATLIQQYLGIAYTPKEMTLQEIAYNNALKYFNHTLKKVEEKGYDTDLIRYLMEANRCFTLAMSKSCHSWIEREQNLRIEKLNQDLAKLSYERDKLAYLLKAGISNTVLTQNEEFFMNFLASNVHVQIRQTTVPIEVRMEAAEVERKRDVMSEIFKEWEKTLCERERNILVKKYLPTASNKKTFKESNCLLLEYLWAMYSKQQEQPDVQEWIVTTLAEIKRMDLYALWTQKSALIIRAMMGEPTEETFFEDESIEQHTSDTKMNRRGKTEVPRTRYNRRKGQRSKTALEETEKLPIMEEMNARLKHIEDMQERQMKMSERLFLGCGSSYPGKLNLDSQYDFLKFYQSKPFPNI